MVYDRTFRYTAKVFKFFALCDGVQPEYAKLYGDYMSGMGLEFSVTISIVGLKSATGSLSYD